ncbi:MAG: M20/M25/M40 family metallo-hydrolase [Terrimicrobiaceae bacterium]|nr:M20/M25/M40 family metallo-hydrolase [Terrimicrobiaceae bacterium]
MQTARFRAACGGLLPAALEFLRGMVEINSFTANAEGVDAVGDFIAGTFAPLGFSSASVPATHPGFGKHRFLSTAPRAGQPTLALVSHLDTVFPPEEERRNDFVWRREGRRIYGPGTNDIKGGTALIFLMLAAMREAAPELLVRANWIVALNACEEVDSSDFATACMRMLPAGTAACLVFEADGGSGDEWALVAARKGRATFTVRVEGKGAHAGGGHAQGANAIVQLAETIVRLAAITDYGAGVTVNVGTISGGTVNNRVPHAAVATLEMRAFDPVAFARARAAILALGGDGGVRSMGGHACSVAVSLDDECAPWPANVETERLLAIWQTAGAAAGLRVARQERGGLSDGNALWPHYPTLDGLGPRGENSHCSERTADGGKEPEWVDAESFVPKAVLNAMAISALLHSQR